MTDTFPCFLQFEFNGERDKPLRYYMDRVADSMGEYKNALYAKMEPFMAKDIPAAAVPHSFCCRVLKCECKCPRPSYSKPQIRIALSCAKPDGLTGSIELQDDPRDKTSNFMIVWKPLQSGVYEWTKWHFNFYSWGDGVWNDGVSRGLGYGTMKDNHYHLVQRD